MNEDIIPLSDNPSQVPSYLPKELPKKRIKKVTPSRLHQDKSLIALPWERQSEEPWQSFNAFVTYRDLLPTERNFDTLSRMIGKTPQTLKKWAKTWEWDERVAAFLDERDRKHRELQLQLRQQMHDRHASQAIRFQDKVMARLETIDIEEMAPKDVIKWWETAVKIENLSRGEATERTINESNVKITGNIDIGRKVVEDKITSEMSCELLERLQLGSSIIPRVETIPTIIEIPKEEHSKDSQEIEDEE
jgi:hypothetical protein